ncbi:hypothetical protein AAF712_012822 [Marasmius tenuissimus]|uniref:Uncharacterized protein n=1 Tax=Marasmius tenuissimus TaxID=585030 RepID=A0ABR2ZFL3_9AGAR
MTKEQGGFIEKEDTLSNPMPTPPVERPLSQSLSRSSSSMSRKSGSPSANTLLYHLEDFARHSIRLYTQIILQLGLVPAAQKEREGADADAK